MNYRPQYFYLLYCVGLFALGAFICFLFKPLIYEIIGKVHPMEPEGEIVDKLEVFV